MPRRFLIACLLPAVLALMPAHSRCQFAETPLSATTIPASQLLKPAELAALLRKNDPGKIPVIIQVGSRVFFLQAHIAGALYAGPGSQPDGLALLDRTVSFLPRDRFIVLYCGCCPWNRCPNVGPALRLLHQRGFTNVKVLYLEHNFGDDWVQNGYPIEKGE